MPACHAEWWLPNAPDTFHPPTPCCLQHAISVKYATEHRCGVVVRGPGLSDQIGGTDPLKDNLPLEVRRGVRKGVGMGHRGVPMGEYYFLALCDSADGALTLPSCC